MQVRAPGYLPTSDSVTMVGGKREVDTYRLQREAVAVTPPPPPPVPRGRAAGEGDAEAGGDDRPGTQRRTSSPPPAAEPVATAAPAATVATPAPAGDHSNLRPVAYGAAIGAGVGLILGAVEGFVAIKKRNEFNYHLGPDPNDLFGGTQITHCNTTAPTDACKSIQDSGRARGRCRSSASSRAACSRAAPRRSGSSRRREARTGRVQYGSRVRT